MSQKKKWSSSAKFEIALLAIKGEVTINEICKRYEVSPTQVHAWKKQVVDQGATLFAKNEKAEKSVTVELERKQSKLYEKIGQLTVYHHHLNHFLQRQVQHHRYMTGAEVITQIRQQKKNHSIPIVVLTAYSDEETINRCKTAGADAI